MLLFDQIFVVQCVGGGGFSRPKGAPGTTDEDFVLLSLRACLPATSPDGGEGVARGYFPWEFSCL